MSVRPPAYMEFVGAETVTGFTVWKSLEISSQLVQLLAEVGHVGWIAMLPASSIVKPRLRADVWV